MSARCTRHQECVGVFPYVVGYQVRNIVPRAITNAIEAQSEPTDALLPQRYTHACHSIPITCCHAIAIHKTGSLYHHLAKSANTWHLKFGPKSNAQSLQTAMRCLATLRHPHSLRASTCAEMHKRAAYPASAAAGRQLAWHGLPAGRSAAQPWFARAT
jgi:hypothetical protein